MVKATPWPFANRSLPIPYIFTLKTVFQRAQLDFLTTTHYTRSIFLKQLLLKSSAGLAQRCMAPMLLLGL